MALIAIDAVVDVTLDALMVSVGLIRRVAVRALEHGIVVRIRMASGADVVRLAVIGRKLRVLRVIESGAGPCSGVVAVLAGRREELRLGGVARVGGVVVIGLVAADTRRRQRRVVVVDVAIGADARRNCVRAGKRERRLVVIERGVGPDRRVVTEFASGWEAGGLVRWIGRACVVLLVTRIAQRRVQRVVVVDVAIGADARRHGMRACELESGAGVIEGAIAPQHCVVTGFARGRESRRLMVHWRGCIVVVVLMATDAGRDGDVVVVIDVAVGALAGRNSVRSGERKSGAVVVERSVVPVGRVVARVAGLREVRGYVIGIGRALVVLQMAGHARGTVQVVVVVDVAIGTSARWNRVRSSQREACVVVVEGRIHPVGGVVARLTSLREVGLNVVGIGRGLVILQVARHALRAI